MNMKKTIALLYGGAGSEHDVSVLGYGNIKELFDKEKYEVIPVFVDKDANLYIVSKNGEKIPTFPVRIDGVSGFFSCGGILPVSCAFPLLHGDMGEDGSVQGLLESARIPYVGEKISVSAVCIDKAYTKRIAESLGIPVAKYVSIRGRTSPEQAESISSEKIGYPMFIKPSALGSSVGACAVHSREDFLRVYELAARLGGDNVLIEELVEDKREVECAVLITEGEIIITHPSEIIISGTYGYSEKYRKKTETRTFADIGEDTAHAVRDYARKLIHGIGIRALSRIDFFLSGERVIFNEINTMPGFTSDSMYLKMLSGAGVAPERVIDTLIERAPGEMA